MGLLIVLTSNARRGAEIEGAALGEQLRRRGMTVDVVALAADESATATLDVPTLGHQAKSLRTFMALRRRARGVDSVIAFGSSTLPACALALVGCRCRRVYRSIGDPAAWAGGSWHRRRTSFLLRRMDRVVALWDGGAAAIRSLYRISASKVSVIPNARSGTDFTPTTDERRADARLRLGLGAHEPVVAVVGAMTPEKRIGAAIQAVSAIDDAQLVIAGDGPERAKVEVIASGAPATRINLLGNVDDPRIVYDAADVLLLTSSTEGMPGVLIEAGLCGLRVVATAVGAVPSMVGRVVGGRTVAVTATVDDIARAVRAELATPSPAPTSPLDATWELVVPRWIELLGSR